MHRVEVDAGLQPVPDGVGGPRLVDKDDRVRREKHQMNGLDDGDGDGNRADQQRPCVAGVHKCHCFHGLTTVLVACCAPGFETWSVPGRATSRDGTTNRNALSGCHALRQFCQTSPHRVSLRQTPCAGRRDRRGTWRRIRPPHRTRRPPRQTLPRGHRSGTAVGEKVEQAARNRTIVSRTRPSGGPARRTRGRSGSSPSSVFRAVERYHALAR